VQQIITIESRSGCQPLHQTIDSRASQNETGAELEITDALLDGDLIAADETGRPQFYDLLRGARRPSYVAFDLLWLMGADLRALPLSERRRRLQSILPTGSRVVSEAPLS
jgi:ATP-dependent DNA ligase